MWSKFKVGDRVLMKRNLNANKNLGIAGEEMVVIKKTKAGLHVEPTSGVKFGFLVSENQIERRLR